MSAVAKKFPREYRPDIDGLRAIAVMAVLLYHVGFDRLSGGFVGVDVFFVISGFLITKLLTSEYGHAGKVDFKSFYIRRAKRLLPALFFTLIVTTIVAVIIFTPQRLAIFGGSMMHAVFSFSNVFFFFESGYFDVDSSLKPLLHTWSLGVEEQFYFIWPLLVFFIASKKLWAPAAYFVLGAISLVLTLMFVNTHASATFFLMPFRVVEFAMGAFLVSLDGRELKNQLISNILFLLGLALIFYSVFYFDKQTQFPGWNALIPCLGTALCIQTGRNAALARILKFKFVVWIGLLSYSLYLIHWPIVVFTKYFFNIEHFTPLMSTLITLICGIAAIFMYLFVEKPFRKIKHQSGTFFLALTIVAFSLVYIGSSMWATQGWAWRPWMTNSLSVTDIERGKAARFETRQKICQSKTWVLCDTPQASTINALVIGDSHAIDGLNAFYAEFPEHDYSMSELGGCPPHVNIDALVTPAHPNLAECKALNAERHNIDFLKQYDYVVINVLFEWYTADHLQEYLRFLNSSGIDKVIVIGGYYSLTEELPEIINRNGFVASGIAPYVIDNSNEEQKLRKYADELGYLFLSKRDVFCEGDNCTYFDGKKIPFTYDKHHLSVEFATRILQGQSPRISDYLANTKAIDVELPVEPEDGSLKIVAWGPKSAVVGQIPNVQPDGNLGVWVKVTELDVSENWRVVFGGIPALSTNLQPGLITAAVNPSMLSEVGEKSVEIENTDTNTIINVGAFVVTAP